MNPSLSPAADRKRGWSTVLALFAAVTLVPAAAHGQNRPVPVDSPVPRAQLQPNPARVTETAQASATWSVQGPAGGRWALRPGRDYEVIVTAGDETLRDLALAGATLQNAETGARLSVKQLKLCRVNGTSGDRVDSTDACNVVDTIEKKKSVTVALRIDDRKVPAGVYKGTLSFTADGGEGLKLLELQVENTTGWRWLLGTLAIAAGVFLSWLLMVLLRQGAARAAALLPAAQLRDTVLDLRAQARSATELTGVPLPTLRTQFDVREKALDLGALEANGLPPRIANPFAASQDATAKYQAYLTVQAGRVATLAVIVRTGVGTAAAKWPNAPDADKEQIRKALHSLDELALKELPVDQATAEVQRILGEITGPAEADTGMLPVGLPPTHEVRVQLERSSVAGWTISLVVTVLAGLVVLVITNYGFGTPVDYVKCLFWGLGLPFVTQQMQQLSPSTVYSTLKVSLPQ